MICGLYNINDVIQNQLNTLDMSFSFGGKCVPRSVCIQSDAVLARNIKDVVNITSKLVQIIKNNNKEKNQVYFF